jgi:uncharacterized membrane protein
MSKVDYFKELAYRLRGLPERERQNILQVYDELFQKAVENGKNEDEIAESLGYPRVPHWEPATTQIPEAPIPSFPYSQPNPGPAPAPYSYPVKNESGVKAILISIALGFFNLTFILGPFVGICGVFIALYASSFAFLVSPLVMLFGNVWTADAVDFQFNIYVALTFFGLGILLSALTVWTSKLFVKLTKAYIQFNVKLIRGA